MVALWIKDRASTLIDVFLFTITAFSSVVDYRSNSGGARF